MKAAIIYQVLTSEKFANQVGRMFEVYSAMLKQVEKDYQYHTKIAATRKAQLQNFGNFMMDLLGFLEGQGMEMILQNSLRVLILQMKKMRT